MTTKPSLVKNPWNTSYVTMEDLHRTVDPFSVGFGNMFKQMQELSDSVVKNIPNYPPYNIKQVNENKYVIELAVAGFAKQDIELTMEGNKLLIKGSTVDSGMNEDNAYIFKGIADRNFTRAFTLADSIEIKDAELVLSLIHI